MRPHGQEHDHINDDEDQVDQDRDHAAEYGGRHLAHGGSIDQGLTRFSAGNPQAPLRFEKLTRFAEDVAYLFLELGPVHGKTVNVPIHEQYDSRHQAYEDHTAKDGCHYSRYSAAFEPAGGAHKDQGEDACEGQRHKHGAGEIEDDAAEDHGEEDGAVVCPKGVHCH